MYSIAANNQFRGNGSVEQVLRESKYSSLKISFQT